MKNKQDRRPSPEHFPPYVFVKDTFQNDEAFSSKKTLSSASLKILKISKIFDYLQKPSILVTKTFLWNNAILYASNNEFDAFSRFCEKKIQFF